jgi:hypothetical protein
LDVPLSVAEGAGRAIEGRPAEFGLQREAARLRARGGVKGLQLPPPERLRLRRLDGLLGRVAQVRRRQAAGTMDQARAEKIVAQLVAAAQ